MAAPADCHVLAPQSTTVEALSAAPRPTSPKYLALPPMRTNAEEPFVCRKRKPKHPCQLLLELSIRAALCGYCGSVSL